MTDHDAIRSRLAAATPGPWGNWGQGWIAPENDPRRDPVGVPQNLIPRTEMDAELIANAPTDLAALLEENEQLRAALVDSETNRHDNINLQRERTKYMRERDRLAAKLAAVEAVADAYGPNPEPEDGWRLARDLRGALTAGGAS